MTLQYTALYSLSVPALDDQRIHGQKQCGIEQITNDTAAVLVQSRWKLTHPSRSAINRHRSASTRMPLTCTYVRKKNKSQRTLRRNQRRQYTKLASRHSHNLGINSLNQVYFLKSRAKLCTYGTDSTEYYR